MAQLLRYNDIGSACQEARDRRVAERMEMDVRQAVFLAKPVCTVMGGNCDNAGMEKIMEYGIMNIPAIVVIAMGSNVQCPFLPCSHREGWGLEAPGGKCDAAFLETIRLIEDKDSGSEGTTQYLRR